MSVDKHLTSTPYFFVAVYGHGVPSAARGQFKPPAADPIEVDYVTVTVVDDQHQLWDLALSAFSEVANFETPPYFLAALDGPYDIAEGNSVDPEFNNPANTYEFWYELTIGVVRIVERAPDAYTVFDFAA